MWKTKDLKTMLKVLEPRYEIPSRTHFSIKIVPELYEQEKNKIAADLSDASSIAITTDGWTSKVTENYITVTAHYITVTQAQI